MDVPSEVRTATEAAARVGFRISCYDDVGRLLSVLAAAVPQDGSVLELGTGAGVGLAWIVSGLAGRTDARVSSVELDSDTAAIAAAHDWPPFVHLAVGDALDVLRGGGRWDLIFADCQGGKWDGLGETIDALEPAGVLLVDDMAPPLFSSDRHRQKTSEVRDRLLGDPRLVTVEIRWSSGVMVCTRRHGE